MVPNSFQLTLQRDIYLYSRTSRVKRQTSEHSGNYHGGSSSTHRSSGGAATAEATENFKYQKGETRWVY